jgi:uncharacterized oligopeptide transporter (OPT) family protein
MSYITLATPIGPWMGPTLALMGTVLLQAFGKRISRDQMLFAVISGSLGGILATALSFSFPTLYFLNPTLFNQWMSQPVSAVGALTAICILAGGLGLWVAYLFEESLLNKEELTFPVGKLVYEIASASDQKSNSKQLMGGFFTTLTYCFIQASTWFKSTIAVSPLTVISKTKFLNIFTIPALQFDLGLMPMLWSIGFIAGHNITIPLLAGALIRIFCADLLHAHYFSYLSHSEFLLAFCSGMVLFGAVMSLLVMPQRIWRFFTGSKTKTITNASLKKYITKRSVISIIGVAGCFFTVLSYFKLSLLAQIYIIVCSALCAYQIAVIAGKIGMAYLGRFATFVMVPGMLLFGLNAMQVTILAAFVQICGGVATEILFGLKTAQLANLNKKETKAYQVVGLIICSITVSIVFWLLVTNFKLGSPQLFAQRGQTRALLVQAGNFDYYVLALGAFFGFVLKRFKLSPMLVLGGLLMSLPLTLGLVSGGLSTFLVKKKQKWEPLCSGMYAANSLWMVIHALW